MDRAAAGRPRRLKVEARFGLLIDVEWRARQNKRLARTLREAKLELPEACIEAIVNIRGRRPV